MHGLPSPTEFVRQKLLTQFSNQAGAQNAYT